MTLNDLVKPIKVICFLISDTLIWEEIAVGGLLPPRRLDFALVLVELPHKFEKKLQDKSQGDGKVDQKESETEKETAVKKSVDGTEPYVPYILLHGGIDETGHIYDDFYVMSLGVENGAVLD